MPAAGACGEHCTSLALYSIRAPRCYLSIEKGTEGTALSLTKRPMSVELADN